LEANNGKPCWVVNFSDIDMQNWNGKYMTNKVKTKKLRSACKPGMPLRSSRQDIVPITFSLAKYARQINIAPSKDAQKQKFINDVLSAAETHGFVSRDVAREIIHINNIHIHPDFKGWKCIVDNNSVTWDQVVSVEKTGIKETGYDLTVPGFETFMNTEGVILSNTMSVHVPVTEKGRQEAFKMLPTNNIFNQATGEIMLAPMNEMILGLYLLTKAGKKTNKKFANLGTAKKALQKGEITVNSIIKIGSSETTIGKAMVNAILPAGLKDPKIYLDKNGVKKLLEKVASNFKPDFGKIVDALKDLGNQHGFKTGFTVGMEDIAPLPNVRAKVELMANNALKTMKKTDSNIVKVYSAAGSKFNEEMMKQLEKNDSALFHMANSGSKGSQLQLRQITTAPNLVQDNTGTVIPEPILRSYSEGLDTADYWNSMYGARAGTIGKSLESSVPGFFTKRLVSSVMGSTVGIKDCGTDRGISEPVDKQDILGRNLAAGNPVALGKKNDDVTSELLSKARKLKMQSIKIRSPLTCEAVSGVCSECFGKMADGNKLDIGDNIGAMAATAMSEPLLNMSMKAFHTGGVAGEGGGIAAVAKGYERIAQLMELPGIVKGKATLSTLDGTVTRIDKNAAGGYNVFVNSSKHFVPQTRMLTAKIGDQVQKGDYLSDGVAKPQELLELKGIQETRNYMTNELQKAYNKPIRRNMFEAVVKEMTNTTQILDPGSNNDYTYGDYAPLSKIEDINKAGGNINHTPILKGINTLPMVSEDWMARLGTRDLAKTIREGAARGWTSDIHGTHPIPGYVYGAEFGLGTEGKY
jgi:DNA-directed RNA polymerase subunit beta'